MEKTKLLHKQQIRFTVDVEVSIRDFPQALIDGTEKDDKYQTWMKENPEDFVEFMGFQKRLLYAVINNPEVISQLVLEKAGLEAASYFEQEYMSSRNEIPLEKTLSPVVNGLGAEDQKRMESLIENGVLADNTETALYDSFKSEVVDTAIEVLE